MEINGSNGVIALVVAAISGGLIKYLADYFGNEQKYNQDGYKTLAETFSAKYDSALEEREKDTMQLKKDYKEVSDKYSKLEGIVDELRDQITKLREENTKTTAENIKLQVEKEQWTTERKTLLDKIAQLTEQLRQKPLSLSSK